MINNVFYFINKITDHLRVYWNQFGNRVFDLLRHAIQRNHQRHHRPLLKPRRHGLCFFKVPELPLPAFICTNMPAPLTPAPEIRLPEYVINNPSLRTKRNYWGYQATLQSLTVNNFWVCVESLPEGEGFDIKIWDHIQKPYIHPSNHVIIESFFSIRFTMIKLTLSWISFSIGITTSSTDAVFYGIEALTLVPDNLAIICGHLSGRTFDGHRFVKKACKRLRCLPSWVSRSSLLFHNLHVQDHMRTYSETISALWRTRFFPLPILPSPSAMANYTKKKKICLLPFCSSCPIMIPRPRHERQLLIIILVLPLTLSRIDTPHQ